jgi:hypothetical protein
VHPGWFPIPCAWGLPAQAVSLAEYLYREWYRIPTKGLQDSLTWPGYRANQQEHLSGYGQVQYRELQGLSTEPAAVAAFICPTQNNEEEQ